MPVEEGERLVKSGFFLLQEASRPAVITDMIRKYRGNECTIMNVFYNACAGKD